MDKPEGPTSHDVVARARRALRTRRIGHTGTLDPFASGLLLLCVGRATRLAEYLTGLDKVYRATARLGATTDTDDRTGAELTRSEAWRELSPSRVETALRTLQGPALQRPPAYSAKKVAGERSYDRARRGAAVELAPVAVEIRRIEPIRVELPEVEFEVECSSGTYVRALARDLGTRLGVGAHLSALRRTRIGAVDLASALPIDGLDDPEAVRRAWIRPTDALAHLPRQELEAAAAAEVAHGRSVAAPDRLPAGATVALTVGGALLAVAEVEDGRLRPRKVFR